MINRVIEQGKSYGIYNTAVSAYYKFHEAISRFRENIFKEDFSVFSHLHPNGNVSMAALEMARLSNSALSGSMLASSHGSSGASHPIPPEFSFPFGFPTPGKYRLVLQFRALDVVQTTSFEIAVQD